MGIALTEGWGYDGRAETLGTAYSSGAECEGKYISGITKIKQRKGTLNGSRLWNPKPVLTDVFPQGKPHF